MDLTDKQQRVMAVVDREGTPTIGEIADTAGLTRRSSARTATVSLVRAGLLEQAGSARSGGNCFTVATAPSTSEGGARGGQEAGQ